MREKVCNIINQPQFDYVLGLIILLNSISIGLEISTQLESQQGGEDHNIGPILYMLEHVFLVIYILELLCRFFAVGLKVLTNPWVMFDFCPVMVGAVTSWILVPIMSQSELSWARKILVFRVLRLLRLV